MSDLRRKKTKIIVILGPTTSGKSDLAVRLARKFDGEVVSADSRQVYKGLDIGTGKITKKEMRGVPHHLLDITDPRYIYSVAEYQKDAMKAVRYIVQKNKLPIVCGGSGFYIDSLLGSFSLPEIFSNKKLRQRLAKKSAQELFKILEKLDSRRAKEIDRHNPVRLIRAIEIAKTFGSVPTIRKSERFNSLKIGILTPPSILKTKIHQRLLVRIKKGMITEARRLHRGGLSWKRMEALGLEYRYLAKYLQGKISKKEMFSKLEGEIWRYVKRQMTWFKRDKKIKWFSTRTSKKIEKEVKKFLKNKRESPPVFKIRAG
jgi:tRNA dimethylallyltransferase